MISSLLDLGHLITDFVSNSLYATTMDKDILLARLGQQIRELRKKKNMTQAELVHAIGKDQQSVRRLEAGKINPSYFYLLEIAVGLDVGIKDVVDISSK